MPKRALAALFAVAVILTACSSGEGAGGQLEGTHWVLQSYDVDGTLTIVPETLYADAKFGTNRVSGFAGCNSFDAVYRSGGRTLFVTQATTTFMACGEEQNAFEASYLALLDQSRFYTARRNTLEDLWRRRRRPPRVRQRAAQPAARELGRRLVRDRPELACRAARGHRADRRLRHRQRRW